MTICHDTLHYNLSSEFYRAMNFTLSNTVWTFPFFRYWIEPVFERNRIFQNWKMLCMYAGAVSFFFLAKYNSLLSSTLFKLQFYSFEHLKIELLGHSKWKVYENGKRFNSSIIKLRFQRLCLEILHGNYDRPVSPKMLLTYGHILMSDHFLLQHSMWSLQFYSLEANLKILCQIVDVINRWPFNNPFT